MPLHACAYASGSGGRNGNEGFSITVDVVFSVKADQVLDGTVHSECDIETYS